ncbi:MAG: cupin domain-containing protein [Acidobacteria bacterium]|nr:cupin domain-containing protein [Acidobacteriota bacterium]
MRFAAVKLFGAVLLMGAMGAQAQTMKSDHWSKAELLERAKHLQEKAAKGDGSASETLEKYPHHYTMLAFRQKSGGGELHQNFADMFVILDGHATVVTGGSVVEQKTVEAGEIRGKSVEGGSRQEVKAGDVVHIPAGMPHQMLVADGETVTYFVVKAEEAR